MKHTFTIEKVNRQKFYIIQQVTSEKYNRLMMEVKYIYNRYGREYCVLSRSIYNGGLPPKFSTFKEAKEWCSNPVLE